MTDGRLTAKRMARIEREARRMRAEALRDGFRALGAFLRGLIRHEGARDGRTA